MQQQVGLEGPTQSMSELDIGPRPAGMHLVVRVDAQQQAGVVERYQRGRLQLVVRILDETGDLARRLAAPSPHTGDSGIAEIGAVQFANPVVREPGALADRAGPGFVANHAQRQLELAPLIGVAIVCQAHILPFMLIKPHINLLLALYHP